MAKIQKKNETPAASYKEEKKRLTDLGPERLYLLWGREDYLRDEFLKLLRERCTEPGTEAFNLHKLDSESFSLSALSEAVNAMPFMGERTLTEVRDFSLNGKMSEDGLAELKKILSDIPDWTTVVFVLATDKEPDGRLAPVKLLRKQGHEIRFESQDEATLVAWLTREAKARGKTLSPAVARYILFYCGTRLYTLREELDKVASYAAGDEITESDVNAMAKKLPETAVFQLTDALGERNFDKAAGLLADLLADKEQPPQMQIVVIGEQYRRMYAARLAKEHRRGDDYLRSCFPGIPPFVLNIIKKAASNYTLDRLARAVVMCEECDLAMKSTGPSPEALMKELILRLATDKP